MTSVTCGRAVAGDVGQVTRRASKVRLEEIAAYAGIGRHLDEYLCSCVYRDRFAGGSS